MKITVQRASGMIFAALSMLLLSACDLATMHHYALDPYERNPIVEWSAEPDAVVVLVGLYSDQQIQVSINASPAAYSYQPIRHYGGKELYPMAFRFKTGDTARLSGVHISSKSDGLKITTESIAFENTPLLKLTRPGIYYYGLLAIENKKGAFVDKFDQHVIDRARESYPFVFENMKPVNFS